MSDWNYTSFHNRMQQRFLVWYQVPEGGGRFSVETHDAADQAEETADLFRKDGYPARVLKVSVDDRGMPLAEWV